MKSRFKIPGMDDFDAEPVAASTKKKATIDRVTHLTIPVTFVAPPPNHDSSEEIEIEACTRNPVLFELGRVAADSSVFYAIELHIREAMENEKRNLKPEMLAQFNALPSERRAEVEETLRGDNGRACMKALLIRHITGIHHGCGDPECRGCAASRDFDPDSTPGSIQIAVDTHSAVSTRFRKFMPGVEVLIVTDADRTNTHLSVDFKTDEARADFERRVAKLDEKGGVS